jgi:signal transduction histidine kinase/ActR/RegA family two-component response regulator
VDAGERGVVWVFHETGVVLFREPPAAGSVGAAGSGSPIFASAAHDRSGVLEAAVQQGGPVLLTAYHTSSDPAFITAVSLDLDEVLADWTHEAWGSAGVLGLIAAMLGIGLVVLFRQMDAKAEAELALTRAQELEAARLREANDRLAGALEREQIARREAEAASQLKDQFLMTVSHELRTPLTAITGWARMLVDGAVSERQKDAALRTIERNAQAQARLIDDLLDVSRVMSGKLQLDVRAIAVEELVRHAMHSVGPAAAAKSIQIECVVDRAAGHIVGDPERLQQIAWNLLSNAVKFTPHGGCVTVTASRAGDDIEIAVRDTGIGIGAEFLPHVFDRFRQQDGGTTRRYGGLGLGLAIVRNLVELHGGSVSARSDGEGSGAVFTVRLPALAAPVTPDSEAATTVTPDPAAATTVTQDRAVPPGARRMPSAAGPLRGIRILLVDDDATARELFTTVLETAGAIVTSTASAPEALAALRRASHEVIVSDIEMPVLDGYDLVREAHAIANGRCERLVAIAVTAYSRPEDEARSLAAGFHLHVRKPVAPGMFVAAVQSACESGFRSDTAEPSTGRTSGGRLT